MHPTYDNGDDKANKEGKSTGYCSDCGMMIIEGETECVRCGGTGLTQVAPMPKSGMWSNGITPSTAGNQRKIVNRI